MPEKPKSNTAGGAGEEKFDGPFHAYAIMHSSNQNDWPTIAVLYFNNVDTCTEWWDLFSKLVKAGKLNSNLWNENTVQRQGMQWYSWPSTGSPFTSLKDVERHPDMNAVKGKWVFKCVRVDNGDGFPNFALQNDSGWPRRAEEPPAPAPDPTQTSILKALERINDSLASIQEDLKASRAASNNAVATTNGANWDDGKNWEGGTASYDIVENAYRKAKELKDRGDDRSFSMIFAQLSMELRRKVGT